jgi:hypothetical protein
MPKLEIEHTVNFEEVRVILNNQLVASANNQKHMSVDIDPSQLPVNVVVEFHPFKIKPIVRYNNFMLDYWLASVQLQDHKLSFDIQHSFFYDYKNKNIQGRIDSLGAAQKEIEHYLDKYVGINNLHPDLVAEIKQLISP